MMAPLALNDIVQNGLCIGCGLCAGISAGAIEMVRTAEGRERPLARQPLSDDLSARVNDICPGLHVEGVTTLETGQEMDPVWGPYHSMDIGYAADADIRYRAATGGVLTALAIFLLETGRVKKIIHVAPDADAPAWSVYQISRSREEVLAGMGSRYGPAAPLVCMEEVLSANEPFAVVAKPCDIAAIRNLARHDARVDELLRYTLVMVCGGASEFTKTEDALTELGITEDEVSLLRYRGHGNPGPLHIETIDGRTAQLSYNDLWAEGDKWRLQFRCKICPDAIGELADVAASDVWPGGGPVGEDDGFNGILARSKAGAELIEAALQAGALVIERAITPRDMDEFQPHQTRKKRAVFDRLRGMEQAGMPVPQFNGLRLQHLARLRENSKREREIDGMIERVRSGKVHEPCPHLGEN